MRGDAETKSVSRTIFTQWVIHLIKAKPSMGWYTIYIKLKQFGISRYVESNYILKQKTKT